MRATTLALVGFLYCAHGVAGSWGQLGGKAPDGSYVIIKDDTLSLRPEIIRSTTDGDTSFPFEGMCSFSLLDSTSPPREFSCKGGQPSPLAGTRYRQVGSRGKCGGMKFVCTAGCESRSVPKNMVFQPWEC